MKRRQFIKQSLSVAALGLLPLAWSGRASTADYQLLQQFLQQHYRLPLTYLQQQLPALWQALPPASQQLLNSLLRSARQPAELHQDSNAGPLLKLLLKTLYTGKSYLPARDQRFETGGGYSRQLLSRHYRARLSCHGQVNFWQQAEGF